MPISSSRSTPRLQHVTVGTCRSGALACLFVPLGGEVDDRHIALQANLFDGGNPVHFALEPYVHQNEIGA